MTDFTLRERLADLISGGALTRARVGEQRMTSKWETVLDNWYLDARHLNRFSEALHAIRNATADGKSGTARMVNRMAREALK